MNMYIYDMNMYTHVYESSIRINVYILIKNNVEPRPSEDKKLSMVEAI